MKRILILLTATLFISTFIKAQSAEDSAKAVVNQLFTAMKNVDAAMLKDAFADSAVLQTIRRKQDGTFFVQNEKVSDFVASITFGRLINFIMPGISAIAESIHFNW